MEHDGRRFRFIDTAGIRRKGKTHLMAEKLSVVMARKHLEAADIALLMIDATEGVSALDAAIAGYAHESGRSVIIIVNKWDLVMSGQKKAVGQAKNARMKASKHPAERASLRAEPAASVSSFCSMRRYCSSRLRPEREQTRFCRCWKKSLPNDGCVFPPRK